MKSDRNRLWIIILGGVIGLVLGAAIPYLLVEPSPRWKHLLYNALAPEMDRAIALLGYDSQDGTLFIKGQSQTIYGCPAEPYGDNSDCHIATSEALAKKYECSGIPTRSDDPPGKAISQMTVFDCRYNEHWTVYTDYVILDDGSLWQITYNSFDLTSPFRNCLTIIGALLGIVIGALIGVLIFGLTHTTSKT